MSGDTETLEYAIQPVPEEKTVSGWQVGCVIVGIAITLPGLYSGGEISQTLGMETAFYALLVAAAVLSIMSIPTAIIGQETRRTSYGLIREVFGPIGGPVINAVFGVILLGWYAVTAELFGRTLMIGFDVILGLSQPQWIFTLISSLLVMITTLYGFKAIDRLAIIAVPLLILVFAYVSLKALQGTLPQLQDIMVTESGRFRWAVNAITGSMIVSVVLMPDLSRYARTRSDAIVAGILGNGGGSVIGMALAMLPAAVSGSYDPMAYMVAAGLGVGALLVLIGATWTTNAVNLYSTGLVVGDVTQRENYRPVITICGVLGTALAIFGIADNLIDFLLLLGALVPPIAGVYLVDYFTLAQRGQNPGTACISALLAASFGILHHFSMLPETFSTGITALDGFMMSAALYAALCWADRRRTVLS